MKKYIIILCALPLFWACNNEELKKLQEENQRLQVEANTKDSTLNSFVQSFNEIEGSLSDVKAKESTIKIDTKAGVELNADVKERIKQDIEQINAIMDANKRKIAELKRQLKNSNLKVAEFEKMVANLNKQIEEKNAEIAALNEQITKLNIHIETLNVSVDTLNKSNKAKSEVISKQTDELNTAYYIIGTSKELQGMGIISKEGGFIGIGKSKKLSQDFDKDKFTRVDITKFSSVSLWNKKVKIITSHPSDSYKIEGTEKKADKLNITDYKKFWKASKFLVVIAE